MNHTWGKELRPVNIETLDKKLFNGLKNKKPKSSLAWALKNKNTIRWGNKADPFQPIERKYQISKKIFPLLRKYDWSFVIQTRNTKIMMDYESDIIKAGDNVTVMPVISPGAEMDWEIFERKRTTPIQDRIDHIVYLRKQGINIGVNGEPFIPGVHTVKMFEDTIKRLKSAGIKSYNTYNFHFNDFVAKRLNKIGIDILAIWEGNQNKNWRPIQLQLCEIAKKYDIVLGCPDFVNLPNDWVNKSNTCCGINVKNPTHYNTHIWRGLIKKGNPIDQIIEETWDGVGDIEQGKRVLSGTSDEFYTMADAGLIKKQGFGI